MPFQDTAALHAPGPAHLVFALLGLGFASLRLLLLGPVIRIRAGLGLRLCFAKLLRLVLITLHDVRARGHNLHVGDIHVSC